MKKLLLLFLCSSVLFAAVLPPAAPVPVTLSWDYPIEELSTNLQFVVYHSSALTDPMNWSMMTNVPGTSTNVVMHVVPGLHVFAMKTKSLFWETESDFSEAVSTPALPRDGSNLKVKRGL